MKCYLIHKMLDCIYAHLVLEVGLRYSGKSFHISYLYINRKFMIPYKLPLYFFCPIIKMMALFLLVYMLNAPLSVYCSMVDGFILILWLSKYHQLQHVLL